MRKDPDKHFGDATYEVWRRGGDSDRVDYERAREDCYDGRSSDFTANMHMRMERNEREFRQSMRDEQEQWDEYYYRQQEQQMGPEQEEPEHREPTPFEDDGLPY